MRQFASRKNYATQLSGLTISPDAVLNTAVFQVSGMPRDCEIQIDPAQLESGDLVEILMIFTDPTISGIALTLWNLTPERTLLAGVTTDGVQPNALFRFSADGCGSLQLLERTIPAFIS